MAPELYSSPPRFSEKSDMYQIFFFSFFYLFKSIFENFRYAFAVLMWEIIMQDVAYKDARPLAIKKEVQAGKRQEINTIGKNNNK